MARVVMRWWEQAVLDLARARETEEAAEVDGDVMEK